MIMGWFFFPCPHSHPHSIVILNPEKLHNSFRMTLKIKQNFLTCKFFKYYIDFQSDLNLGIIILLFFLFLFFEGGCFVFPCEPEILQNSATEIKKKHSPPHPPFKWLFPYIALVINKQFFSQMIQLNKKHNYV